MSFVVYEKRERKNSERDSEKEERKRLADKLAVAWGRDEWLNCYD